MAKYCSPNPKIKAFNDSIIKDKSPAARRSQNFHKKGTIKGFVEKKG